MSKSVSDSNLLEFGQRFRAGLLDEVVKNTGAEDVAGIKTFSDGVRVADASKILYSGGGGGGFTAGVATATLAAAANSIAFTGLAGEPRAFIVECPSGNAANTVLAMLGDSSGAHGVHTTGTQHNYSAGYTFAFSNGTLTVTAPTGISFGAGQHTLRFFYGSGTLTFRQTTVAPGSGVTAVTFTDAALTELPALYAVFLETAVNSESYRRVASVTGADDGLKTARTFASQTIYDTTANFSQSYNNGLYVNSGGTNSGGYFHNPGTYRLYFLAPADVAGGGASFSSLGDELDDIRDTIGDIETLLAAI